MIDERRVAELCRQIEDGPISGGIDPRTAEILGEIERIVGRIVVQYTDPLRRLLKKRRIDDLNEHKVDIYGQTHRITGIASMCNQATAARLEREAKFKVEVPEPMHWPEKGDLQLSASVHIDGSYCGSIRCIVRCAEIDAIPISSRSLSKRDARMRRLGNWMQLFCNEFKYHIERLHEDGQNVRALTLVNYRDIESYMRMRRS